MLRKEGMAYSLSYLLEHWICFQFLKNSSIRYSEDAINDMNESISSSNIWLYNGSIDTSSFDCQCLIVSTGQNIKVEIFTRQCRWRLINLKFLMTLLDHKKNFLKQKTTMLSTVYRRRWGDQYIRMHLYNQSSTIKIKSHRNNGLFHVMHITITTNGFIMEKYNFNE